MRGKQERGENKKVKKRGEAGKKDMGKRAKGEIELKGKIKERRGEERDEKQQGEGKY